MSAILRRMERVQFRWWPWGLLAAGMPLPLVMVALPLAVSGGEGDRTVGVAATLSCMGAWNALLMGAAIGDFGRALLAVLAGATGALLVAGTADAPFSVGFVGQLVVWLAIGTALPVRWSVEGLFESIAACGGAFGRQLAVSVVGGVLTVLVFGLSAPLSSPADRLVTGSVWFVLAAAGNVWAIHYLFRHAFRAGAGSRGGVAWRPSAKKLRSMTY